MLNRCTDCGVCVECVTLGRGPWLPAGWPSMRRGATGCGLCAAVCRGMHRHAGIRIVKTKSQRFTACGQPKDRQCELTHTGARGHRRRERPGASTGNTNLLAGLGCRCSTCRPSRTCPIRSLSRTRRSCLTSWRSSPALGRFTAAETESIARALDVPPTGLHAAAGHADGGDLLRIAGCCTSGCPGGATGQASGRCASCRAVLLPGAGGAGGRLSASERRR